MAFNFVAIFVLTSNIIINFAMAEFELMATTRIKINANILTWAIERVGYNIDEFLCQNPKVEEWISGSKLPTLKNLDNIAKKLYVPLGYLFLNEPPVEECPIPFFRSTTNNHNNINIYDTVLAMQDRQEWLSNYLKMEGMEKLDFVGMMPANMDQMDAACNEIRKILNIPINWAADFRSVEDAIRYLTVHLEDRGIIVCFNGVVGFNNNRTIPVKDCRGFALIDDYCPFIFVNNKDAKQAQVFTIFHELVHILIGYSAGYGDNDTCENQSTLEAFCDKVAANCLVPECLLLDEWAQLGENYDILTKRFKVSRYVVARRAKEIGLISEQRYFYLYNKWNREHRVDSKVKSGGSFIPMAIKKTSRTFLAHVDNAISNNRLLYMDAYRLTGLKGDTFHKVVNSPDFYRS